MIDSSIALQGQPVQLANPLDLASKAMQMQSLASRNQVEGLQAKQAQQEYNDQKTLRDVTNANTSVDAAGMPTIDRQGMLKDLSQGANPSLATKAVQNFAAMDIAKQQQQAELMHGKWSALGQLMGSVSDQKSYDDALAQAKQLGVDTSQFPPQVDMGVVKNMQMKALTAKDQIEAQQKQFDSENKARELQIEGKKLDIDLFKTYGKPGNASNGAKRTMDPSDLVSTTVPPDQRSKVFDEIKAAQNTAKSAPQILAAFDRAAKEVHAADFVPGMHNADQKALHALMGPTFQDVEGTVRQAAMDNMNENTTPQFLDNANSIARKRAALVGYLTSKSAAPTAKGFGIDLSQYQTTHVDPKILEGSAKKTMVADTHKDLPVGAVSNGYVKTAAGWVPQGANVNASK